MSDKDNLLRDLDKAGFVEDRPEDIIAVTELKDRYIFIHICQYSGEYTVGDFFKATPTKMADFSGMPLAICEKYEEASKFKNDFIKDIAS